MKRLAVVALVVAGAACSGASGPRSGFSGTWQGAIPGGLGGLILIATQTDSTVGGNGNLIRGTLITTFAVSGTSSSPTIQLALALPGGPWTYVGTYITSDSVSGVLKLTPADSMPVSFKRQ